MAQDTEQNKTKDPNVPDNPTYAKEYELYLIWLAMPANIKGRDDAFYTSIGLTDDDFIEVSKLKTKTAFAEHFQINRTQLNNWDKMAKTRSTMDDARKWMTKLTPRVGYAHFQHILQSGNPGNIREWYNTVERIGAKQDHDHTHNVPEEERKMLMEILNRNRNGKTP